MRCGQDYGERSGLVSWDETGSFGYERQADRWSSVPAGADVRRRSGRLRGGPLLGYGLLTAGTAAGRSDVGDADGSTPRPRAWPERYPGSATDGMRALRPGSGPARAAGYARGRVHSTDPQEWPRERDRLVAELRDFASDRGLALVGVHADPPRGDTRRPGLAALVRQVAVDAVSAVLVADGRHLSVAPDVRAALIGLITDLGAQVVSLDPDEDQERPRPAESGDRQE